jgi:hypothetical protein
VCTAGSTSTCLPESVSFSPRIKGKLTNGVTMRVSLKNQAR